jgi:hypothetical protein
MFFVVSKCQTIRKLNFKIKNEVFVIKLYCFYSQFCKLLDISEALKVIKQKEQKDILKDFFSSSPFKNSSKFFHLQNKNRLLKESAC